MLTVPFLEKHNKPLALIVLNSPVPSDAYNLFERVWRSAHLKFCADGGANCLYDLLNEESRPEFFPDLIIGDLDSLRNDTRKYYESHNVPVVLDGDQYSTDLNKAISAIGKHKPRDRNLQSFKSVADYDILIFGGTSGRLDQTIHTLVALHQYRKLLPQTKIWVINEFGVTVALDKGTNLLNVDSPYLGPTCGILPVGVDRARLTTRGLRWNLDDAVTSFDGMVSTSNHLADKIVEISSDKPLIWTCELQSFATKNLSKSSKNSETE